MHEEQVLRGYNTKTTVKMPSNRKNGKFGCEKCGKIFKDYYTRGKHQMCHRPDITGFDCVYCHNIFDTKEEIEEHMPTHARPPFKCLTCKVVFYKLNTFSKHNEQCGKDKQNDDNPSLKSKMIDLPEANSNTIKVSNKNSKTDSSINNDNDNSKDSIDNDIHSFDDKKCSTIENTQHSIDRERHSDEKNIYSIDKTKDHNGHMTGECKSDDPDEQTTAPINNNDTIAVSSTYVSTQEDDLEVHDEDDGPRNVCNVPYLDEVEGIYIIPEQHPTTNDFKGISNMAAIEDNPINTTVCTKPNNSKGDISSETDDSITHVLQSNNAVNEVSNNEHTAKKTNKTMKKSLTKKTDDTTNEPNIANESTHKPRDMNKTTLKLSSRQTNNENKKHNQVNNNTETFNQNENDQNSATKSRKDVDCFRCPCSNKVFPNRDALLVHVAHTHWQHTQTENLFRCYFCSKVCRSEPFLTKHIKEKHSDKKIRYTCPLCSATFPECEQLRKHADLHIAPISKRPIDVIGHPINEELANKRDDNGTKDDQIRNLTPESVDQRLKTTSSTSTPLVVSRTGAQLTRSGKQESAIAASCSISNSSTSPNPSVGRNSPVCIKEELEDMGYGDIQSRANPGKESNKHDDEWPSGNQMKEEGSADEDDNQSHSKPYVKTDQLGKGESRNNSLLKVKFRNCMPTVEHLETQEGREGDARDRLHRPINIQRQRDTDKRYKCNECSSSFDRQTKLETHIKTYHATETNSSGDSEDNEELNDSYDDEDFVIKKEYENGDEESSDESSEESEDDEHEIEDENMEESGENEHENEDENMEETDTQFGELPFEPEFIYSYQCIGCKKILSKSEFVTKDELNDLDEGSKNLKNGQDKDGGYNTEKTDTTPKEVTIAPAIAADSSAGNGTNDINHNPVEEHVTPINQKFPIIEGQNIDSIKETPKANNGEKHGMKGRTSQQDDVINDDQTTTLPYDDNGKQKADETENGKHGTTYTGSSIEGQVDTNQNVIQIQSKASEGAVSTTNITNAIKTNELSENITKETSPEAIQLNTISNHVTVSVFCGRCTSVNVNSSLKTFCQDNKISPEHCEMMLDGPIDLMITDEEASKHYFCEKCDDIVDSAEHFYTHIVHCLEEAHNCIRCDAHIQEVHAFEVHKKKCMGYSIEKSTDIFNKHYTCLKCQFETVKYKDYHKHQTKCINQKSQYPKMNSLEDIGLNTKKQASSQNILKSHVLCTFCKKKFSSKANYNIHYKMIHAPIAFIHCPICDQFKCRKIDVSVMISHIGVCRILEVHSKKLSSKVNDNQHIIETTGREAHELICDKCFKGIHDENSFKDHRQKCPGNLRCWLCKEMFIASGPLEIMNSVCFVKYKPLDYLQNNKDSMERGSIKKMKRKRIESKTTEKDRSRKKIEQMTNSDFPEKVENQNNNRKRVKQIQKDLKSHFIMTKTKLPETVGKRQNNSKKVKQIKESVQIESMMTDEELSEKVESKNRERKQFEKMWIDDMIVRPTCVCKDCNGIFLNAESLRKHSDTCQPWLLRCNFCGTFKCPSSDITKMRTHSQKCLAREMMCDKCGIHFENYVKLKAHLKFCIQTHACPYCEMEHSQMSFRSHIRMVCMRKDSKIAMDRLQCVFCLSKHLNTKQLKEHMNTCDRFKCLKCNLEVSDKEALRHHYLACARILLLRDRSIKEPYLCEKCGEILTFDQYDDYPHKLIGMHMEKHKMEVLERSHICETCGKGFKTPSQLKSHSLSHKTVRDFKCDQCDKTFKSQWRLRSHTKRYHGDKMKSYTCEQCGAHFLFGHLYARHQVVHTGERAFKCGTCGKTFTQMSSLKRHEQSHAGIKKHVCPHCGVKYSQRYPLSQHMEKQHGVTAYHLEQKRVDYTKRKMFSTEDSTTELANKGKTKPNSEESGEKQKTKPKKKRKKSESEDEPINDESGYKRKTKSPKIVKKSKTKTMDVEKTNQHVDLPEKILRRSKRPRKVKYIEEETSDEFDDIVPADKINGTIAEFEDNNPEFVQKIKYPINFKK